MDGELRQIDEEFSNGLLFPGDPHGEAAEVVNCRCALLQRAKWALDQDELDRLQQRAEYYGLDKTESFEDFKRKYLKLIKKNDIITKVRNGEPVNPMDEVRYLRMKEGLQKHGIIVVEAHGDDLRFLENALHAEASYGNGVILHMGRTPSASAMFEEVVHAAQARIYGELDSSDPVELYAREIAANRKLLKHHLAYGFDESDVSDVQKNLAFWEEAFKRKFGVPYDKCDIKREV